MRERVLQIAEDLGHASSERAAQLREQRTRVIGLVLTDIANPFYTEVAAGAIDAARPQGYEVFLAHTQESAETLAGVVDAMVARQVDGVVFTVLHPDDGEVIRRMRRAHIPFIQLSRRIPTLDADFVGIDDRATAAEMMEHVLGHGYTDLAVVAGPRNSTASAARVEGFHEALARKSVQIPPNRTVSTYLSEDGGRRAVEQLLADGTLPRAIVCGSDAVAAGVIGALFLRGLRVPADVAVTGFDGLYPEASPLATLTTVSQPRRTMAEVALAQLIRRIDGSGGAHQELVQAHELRVGTTCGCPPGEGKSSG